MISLRAARVNRNLTLLEAAKYLKINKDEVPSENLYFGDTQSFVAQFKPLPEVE